MYGITTNYRITGYRGFVGYRGYTGSAGIRGYTGSQGQGQALPQEVMTTNVDQTMTQKLIQQDNTDYEVFQVRNIIISDDFPNNELGGNGSIWITYPREAV